MRAAARHPQLRRHRKFSLPPSKALPLAVAAVAALAAGIWGALQWQARAPAAATLQSGVVLAQPRPIAEFALLDQDGKPFTREQLRGRWTVLFAGFTHCPDVCPTTLGLMKALTQRLAQPAPAMVFLSVDPERDTQDALAAYVRHFGAAIQGVTGPREELDRLCASLGIAYLKIPGATEGDYTVDHSAALVLIDPQARVAGYFPPPHKLDTLAADLSEIAGT
jgi:protein SCO1